MPCLCLQVSADKLDSITAFPKFFSQASYTKLASYRRAIFQALEVSFFISSNPESLLCVIVGSACFSTVVPVHIAFMSSPDIQLKKVTFQETMENILILKGFTEEGFL